MVIRDKERTERFVRAAKARNQTPAMIIRFPFGLAEVWPYDGCALIVPGWRRSAILADWSTTMRHVRKSLAN